MKHQRGNHYHLLLVNDERKQIFSIVLNFVHPKPRPSAEFRRVTPARLRARRAALSRGWCALHGRRPPVVEFVSSSRKVRSPRLVPPRFLSFRPTRWKQIVEGAVAPRCFSSNEQPFLSACLSLDRRSAF